MDNRTIAVTPAQSLAELATRIPAASRVFREAGLGERGYLPASAALLA